MTDRLHTIVDHIAVKPNDSTEFRALKQRLALASLTAQFTLSTEQLRAMAYYFLHEMHEGLAGRPSTLAMLPSYVYRADTVSAHGVYYALDLGGTNFRVIRMVLEKGVLVTTDTIQDVIPQQHVKGTAEGLFGFIAALVETFFEGKGAADLAHARKTNSRIALGFTFSFPVTQSAVNAGKLNKWTKEFTTSGVVGENVVKLLQAALLKRNLPIDCVALCNDTVGTLIARFFKESTVEMGVILGTGANACYWERSAAVTKDHAVRNEGERETVINMEFGNFDSAHLHCLPVTEFDNAIEAASDSKGQRFEKMISGKYLGEISRQVLVKLGAKGVLPSDVAKKLATPYGFTSKDSGLISADRLPGLCFTQNLLKERYGITLTDINDLYTVKVVCVLVRSRAAQLAAMAISATLLKAEKTGNATVAVDGSVYEKTPSFRTIMATNIRRILGEESDVRLVLQRDGSGLGAGYIAALTAATSNKK